MRSRDCNQSCVVRITVSHCPDIRGKKKSVEDSWPNYSVTVTNQFAIKSFFVVNVGVVLLDVVNLSTEMRVLVWLPAVDRREQQGIC